PWQVDSLSSAGRGLPTRLHIRPAPRSHVECPELVPTSAAPVQDETVAPGVICQRCHLVQIPRSVRATVEPHPLPTSRGEQVYSRIPRLAIRTPGELITGIIQAGRPVHSHTHSPPRCRD